MNADIESKTRKLLVLLEGPLKYIKDDFEGHEWQDSLFYKDIIEAMNLRQELIEELKKEWDSKYSSHKFKQQKLY